jgi:eukaryotic-like serine/threonine-protein kinase
MVTLSPDQWQALSPYLDEALVMTEKERSLWLSDLRSRNQGMAEQVEMLFREHRALSEEGFLENGSVGLPRTSGLQGQTLGAYTLVSQIGHGGMGSVWLAQRSDGRFERQVAVKFLNIALMGRGGEERFKREGSVLGRLAHPHIAELIDAGVSQTGQPYLVLEHVEGDHIDRYCDGHTLDIKERIRLFLDVLTAVAQAHANLIVHRDLKPSNVLVRNDGRVKLLDFGIAKLLEGDGHPGETAPLTIDGARAMTPEYAAPEQLLGGTITTGTDVYALGVLLYVLLTGQHPAGGIPRTPVDIVKAIVDARPTRPSDAVAPTRIDAELATANAAKRATTPDRLRRLLHGDLDTIVGKALKKEPTERYCSATDLAEDLRRYLRNQPISARPDSVCYRAAKFVRRNRTMVVLTTLAILATAAGVVGTLIQARTAREQRAVALRQLVRAEATIEFNEFLLSDAAPSGKPFTVNELLGSAENILARQRNADDTSRAELMVVIGDQYSTQDEDAKARRVLEAAYKLSRPLKEPTARAETSCSLAGVLARDGELDRAEALIQEGLRELPAGSQYDMDRIFCLRRGSEVAQERGDSQQGLARIQAVQRILKQSPFCSENLQLHTAVELAEAYRVAGQNYLASSTFEQAAALLEPLGRSDTQTAVVIFNDWALALDKLGRPLEAEKLFRRAIDISRAGKTEETVSPVLLDNYSRTLYQLGRLEEAADYDGRAYAKALQTSDQMAIYRSLYGRALIDLEQRHFKHAATMLGEMEPILRRSLPSDSYWFGALASAQALLAADQGNFQAALRLADQAVAIVEAASKAGRAGSDFLPVVLMRRSTVELAAGQPERAGEDAERALTQLQAAVPHGAFSSMIGRTYLNLGRALQSEGKRDQAEAAFRSAAEQLQNSLGPDHPDTRGALQLAQLNKLYQ